MRSKVCFPPESGHFHGKLRRSVYSHKRSFTLWVVNEVRKDMAANEDPVPATRVGCRPLSRRLRLGSPTINQSRVSSVRSGYIRK